jgi:dTDP-4-amino-4,6-dideoxygalactose transaminase
MGLCNLEYIDVNLRQRRQVVERYDHNLALTALRRPRIADRCQWNCAYYPVICESEAALQRVVTDLNAHGIQPRRYFYPSLSTLPFVDRRCQTPISDDAAPRVLCLPLYPSLSLADVDWICSLVAASLSA